MVEILAPVPPAGPTGLLEQVSLIEGEKHIHWLHFEKKLPLRIKYNFVIKSEEHELIGVFSKQQGPANDALTWWVASHATGFQFRTKLFGSFPENHSI